MGIFRRPESPFWWLWLETAPKGRQRERTDVIVGTTTAQRRASRKLAQQVYFKRMGDLATTRHGLPTEPERITLALHAAWWLAHVAVHHRGYSREQEIVQTLTAALGDLALDEITKARVFEYITARRATVAAGTVNREVDVLKQILTSAVPEYLPANPIARLRRVHGAETEARTLSRADERRLLKVLAPPDRALVLLALDCLLRLSDAINLTRAHDHGAYLSVLNSKTGSYKVPVSGRVRKALDALPKDGEYYFAGRRRAAASRDYRSSVKSMLRRACAKAGIAYGRGTGITFHGLRHTGATRMVEAGVPLRIVQAIGGWRSLRQLERYAHPSDEATRDAVETVGRRRRFGHNQRTPRRRKRRKNQPAA
jgi:integrase